MTVNWSALGSTAAVSLLLTVAVVVLFSLGVAALSRRPAEASTDASAATPAAPAAPRGPLALPAATLCFAVCAAAVGYGLYLIAAG